MTTEAATQETNEAAAETGAVADVVATGEQVEGTAAETAAGAEPAKAEATDAGSAVRPEQLPDQYWDADKGSVKVADLLKDHLALKTEVDAARADVPETADGYELKVSDAVKLPEGYALDIAADSPFAKEIFAAAHQHKMPRVAVQALVDAEARRQIAEQTAGVEQYVADKSALGENADKRIEAVTNWVGANVSSKNAEALMMNIGPGAVAAIEEIIAMRADPDMPGGVAAVTKANPKDRADRWYRT